MAKYKHGRMQVVEMQKRLGKRLDKISVSWPPGYVQRSTAQRVADRLAKNAKRDSLPSPARTFQECRDLSMELAKANGNGSSHEKSVSATPVKRIATKIASQDPELPPTGEFEPNKGTVFEGMKFLADCHNKTELTEEDLQAALYIAREGGSRVDCASVIGVAEPTLIKLEARNPMWAAAFDRARTLSKLALIHRIRIGDSHWQAAAWMLERRYRKEYSANVPIEEENRIVRVRPVTPKVVALPGVEDQKQLLGSGSDLEQAAVKRVTEEAVADGNVNDSESEQQKAKMEQPGQTNIENGVDALIDLDGSTVQINTPKAVIAGVNGNGRAVRGNGFGKSKQMRTRRVM